jgi:hypothetical protein
LGEKPSAMPISPLRLYKIFIAHGIAWQWPFGNFFNFRGPLAAIA